jgi:thioredoxin-like negative regulator of GroEL
VTEWLHGPPSHWIEELAALRDEYGFDGFLVGSDQVARFAAEVAVLLARARLAAEAADPASRFATAAAQAADGQPDPALAELLAAVREGPGETRDHARELMLDVFRLLGDDHPLTAIYRKNLTRALF